MIIDFHTHIWPSKSALKTLKAVQRRAGIPYFTDGTINGLLRSMNTAGVDISVVSRITSRSSQVAIVNGSLGNMAQKNIIPMATWLPDLPVEPDLIGRLLVQGFKCMKLHPDYQGFFIDDRRMFPLYEAAEAEGMPILIHAGLDRGLKPPWHAMPDKVAAVCKDFPHLRIIAAHMGGEDNYRETENFLLGKDLYLDTSFILKKMPVEILKRFTQKHPADRILFGSDSPWVDQSEDLEYLFSLPFLNQEAKEKIAGANAASLLGL